MREKEVSDATRFEGAGGLQVLEFEVDLASGGLGQGGGVDKWGPAPWGRKGIVGRRHCCSD